MTRLALLFCLLTSTVHAVDTHDCQYWITYLEEVARIEHALLYAVPQILEQENVFSAMDLQLDLRELLDRYRRRIDKEVSTPHNGTRD